MNVAHLYIDLGIVDVLTERTLVQIDGMDVHQVFLKLVGLIVSLVAALTAVLAHRRQEVERQVRLQLLFCQEQLNEKRWTCVKYIRTQGCFFFICIVKISQYWLLTCFFL
ncbi:hypothetical protein DPMN_177265 [Dreissena polymorpha]|uniref:Uncharacterized protein n=1 Tax=Dreissena polymorpha TaxID=45954 RepID=A0A9D4EBU3_DREPO|nr:hypothetical protein DPMN_177265 [Dreissena polymorpha]